MTKKDLRPLIEATRRYNRLKGVRDTEKQLRYFERKFAEELGVLFIDQGKIFLELFEKMQQYFKEEIQRDTEYSFNTMEYVTFNRFKDLVIRYRLLGAKVAEQSILSTMDIETSFDKYDADAYTALEQTAAERVTGINDTTRGRIKEIIMQGYEERKTYSQIARDIKNEFNEFAAPAPQRHVRNRAEVVAVTELRDAHETSQRNMVQTFADRGYEMEKSAMVTKDERLCPICRANAEAGWIPFNALFPDGNIQAPFHPVCRCRTIHRVKPGTMGVVPVAAGA